MKLLSRRTVDFLTELRTHNDRTWFAAHRADYERHFKEPAEHFALMFAAELQARLGEAHDHRIFRIHRDVRFSKDKTPYNAHLHISFSPGGACRDGGSAWMFGLDPDGLTLGAGTFAFGARQLEHWRERCSGPEGAEIAGLLTGLRAADVRIQGPELKRVPAPYDSTDPNAELLRRKGLTAWIDVADPQLAFGEGGPRACVLRLMVLKDLFLLLRGLESAPVRRGPA